MTLFRCNKDDNQLADMYIFFLILITPIELWREGNAVTVKHLHEMIRWAHIDQETSVSMNEENLFSSKYIFHLKIRHEVYINSID